MQLRKPRARVENSINSQHYARRQTTEMAPYALIAIDAPQMSASYDKAVVERAALISGHFQLSRQTFRLTCVSIDIASANRDTDFSTNLVS